MFVNVGAQRKAPQEVLRKTPKFLMDEVACYGLTFLSKEC